MAQSCIPHVEIFHLYICESTRRVQTQLEGNLVEDLVNVCMSKTVMFTKEVLLIGLEPPDIVMSMWDKMYS